MKRLFNLVEGQTEEQFTKEVLYHHLYPLGVFVEPILIQDRQGGHCGRYSKIWPDIPKLLKGAQGPSSYVTTQLDLYALPVDFPGSDGTLPIESQAKAQALEAAFQADIEAKVGSDLVRQFIPNLMVHEFEMLCFVDPEVTQQVLYEQPIVEALQRVIAQYASPEDINSGRETAPSKRMEAIYPRCDKVNDGTLIALSLPLGTIRTRCPHFDGWLRRLEQLGESPRQAP